MPLTLQPPMTARTQGAAPFAQALPLAEWQRVDAAQHEAVAAGPRWRCCRSSSASDGFSLDVASFMIDRV